MTTVRLNDEILNKISALVKVEKITKSEIIKKAIVEYYNRNAGEINPYELGKDLFGRYGSNEVMSDNYKNKLKEKLREKYSH